MTRSLRADVGRVGAISLGDGVVLSALALLPLAHSTALYGTSYIPKLGLLLVVGAIGLGRLALQLRSGADAPGWAAVVLLSATWLSVGFADHALPSAIGSHSGFTSGMMVTALVGGWAAGRSLGPRSRELLVPAAAVGVVITAAVVWAQALGAAGWWVIPEIRDRPGAFVGNPVYAGALLAGALALVVRPVVARSGAALIAGLGAVALLVGGLNLAGGRISSAAGLVGLGLACRSLPTRRVAAVVLVALVGIGASLAVGSIEGTSATQRTRASASSGIEPRVDMWEAGFEAWRERPVTGWGPGRFGAATAGRGSEAFARSNGGDLFLDAHNLVVEELVTTGVVGLTAMAAWLVLAARRARGPLALGALAYGLNLLLQPSTPVTLWAVVLLGAALPSSPRPRLATARTDAVLAGAGAILATVTLLSALLLQVGVREGSLIAVERSRSMLPPLAEPYLVESLLRASVAPSGGPARAAWLDQQRTLLERARQADPARYEAYARRGEVEAYAGLPAAARHWYRQALARNPNDPSLLQAAAAAADEAGAPAEARAHRARGCRIDPAFCPGG